MDILNVIQIVCYAILYLSIGSLIYALCELEEDVSRLWFMIFWPIPFILAIFMAIYEIITSNKTNRKGENDMKKAFQGARMTCDRCGKVEYVEGIISDSNWRIVMGCDICPDCYEEYKEVMEVFLDPSKHQRRM